MSKIITYSCSLTLFLTLLLGSLNCQAALSKNVDRAMSQSRECQQIQQNYTYAECMLDNFERISRSIETALTHNPKHYSDSLVKKIRHNIKQDITKRKKSCLNQSTYFSDNLAGSKRNLYCQFENLVEVLVNVERDIDIYKK